MTVAADTINVPAGFYYLSEGPLDIASSISIVGDSRYTTIFDLSLLPVLPAFLGYHAGVVTSSICSAVLQP